MKNTFLMALADILARDFYFRAHRGNFCAAHFSTKIPPLLLFLDCF